MGHAVAGVRRHHWLGLGGHVRRVDRNSGLPWSGSGFCRRGSNDPVCQPDLRRAHLGPAGVRRRTRLQQAGPRVQLVFCVHMGPDLGLSGRDRFRGLRAARRLFLPDPQFFAGLSLHGGWVRHPPDLSAGGLRERGGHHPDQLRGGEALRRAPDGHGPDGGAGGRAAAGQLRLCRAAGKRPATVCGRGERLSGRGRHDALLPHGF